MKPSVILGIMAGIVGIVLILVAGIPMISDYGEQTKIIDHKNETGYSYMLIEGTDPVVIETDGSDTATINDRPYRLVLDGSIFVISDGIMMAATSTAVNIWTPDETFAITPDSGASATVSIDGGTWTVRIHGDVEKSSTGTYTYLYHLGGAAGNFIAIPIMTGFASSTDIMADSDSLILISAIGEMSITSTPAEVGDHRTSATSYTIDAATGDIVETETTITWMFDPATNGGGTVGGIIVELGGDLQATVMMPLKYQTTEQTTLSSLIFIIPLILAVILLVAVATSATKLIRSKNDL